MVKSHWMQMLRKGCNSCIEGQNLLCFLNFTTNRNLSRKMIKDIDEIFDELLERDPIPPVESFNMFLGSVLKKKEHGALSHIFRKMNMYKLPIDMYTLNMVTKGFSELRKVDFGFSLVGLSFKLGFKPDVITIGTLVDGLVKEERLRESIELFLKVFEQDLCEPNTMLFNIGLHGLCKFGMIDYAMRFFKSMETKFHCQPTIYTYSTLISSLCDHSWGVGVALSLFNAMVYQRGIKPNVAVYNSLLRCFLCFVNWADGNNVLKEMEKNEVPRDIFTFNILIHAHATHGNMKNVEALLGKMIQEGIKPDTVTMTSVIKGYCQEREMWKARKHLNSMRLMRLEPNVMTYNSLMYGYCLKSDIKQCMLLYEELQNKGLKPSQITYNILIQGLFHVGHWKQAMEMFSKMESEGFKRDYATCRIIVEGYVENNLLHKALSFFRSTHDGKMILDIEFYNTLLRGASKFKGVRELLALFVELTVKGLRPDIYTFNAMIKGFCRHGLLVDALHWYNCIELYSCKSNGATFNLLVRALVRNYKVDNLKKILKKMAEAGFELDPSSAEMVRYDRKLSLEVLELLVPFMPYDHYAKLLDVVRAMKDESGEKGARTPLREILPAGRKIGIPNTWLLELMKEEVEFPRNKCAGSQAVNEEAEAKKLTEKLDDKSGEKEQAAKSAGEPKTKGATAVEKEVTIDRLDIRVGVIKEVQKHPDADSLYVEKIDVGEEEPRTVVSGRLKYIPVEEMQNRKVCVLCNPKPATMRGIKSQAMVLCASTSDKVEFVEPPEGAAVGERVTFPGFDGEPDDVLNPKKKVWETLQVDLHSDKNLVACYKDLPFTTSAGVCKVSSISDGSIR
ncbi:putative tRNA-binding domain, tetratricopeptide-like helical domain superfamily [Helianthus debilis subsp. tardiflorus]